MGSKNELKEIENRTWDYFDYIMRFWDRDIDFSDILLDEKLYNKKYENISIYNISYKTSKIDGFIRIHNKIRYLVLFDYSYCDKICDKIKYLISEKGGITDSINHNFAKIRIDSYDSLPIEKMFTFHNVIILIKSVVNRNKNEYYYNAFLEKYSYKDISNTEYF